jgi:hypothetical protein
MHKLRPPASSTLRLVPEGTRVILLGGDPPHVAGVITAVRRQPHLKSYVVNCDSGAVAYVSPCDLAREGDPSATPLGPRFER